MSTKYLDSNGLRVLLSNLKIVLDDKLVLESTDDNTNWLHNYSVKDGKEASSYIYSTSYVDTMISNVTTDYKSEYTYLLSKYDKLLQRVEALEAKTNNTGNNNIYLSTEMQTIAYANGVNIQTAVKDIPNGIPNEESDTIMGAFAYAGILF